MLYVIGLDAHSSGVALADDGLGKTVVPDDQARKGCAAARLHLAVSKKSTGFPALSTARYKYIHSPPILIYVSSMRQLIRWTHTSSWSIASGSNSSRFVPVTAVAIHNAARKVAMKPMAIAVQRFGIAPEDVELAGCLARDIAGVALRNGTGRVRNGELHATECAIGGRGLKLAGYVDTFRLVEKGPPMARKHAKAYPPTFRQRVELVLDALNMAIYRRRPTNVIHHSDQAANTRRSRLASVAKKRACVHRWLVGDCYGQCDVRKLQRDSRVRVARQASIQEPAGI